MCRRYERKLICALSYGFFGWVFIDASHHHYVEERKVERQKDIPETVLTSQSEVFLELSVAIEKLTTTKPQRKVNPLLYFFVFLLQHLSEVSHEDANLVTCRDYMIYRLEELKIDYDSSLLDLFLKCYKTELNPVSAIMGGTVAQECLKILSAKELPIKSFFVYNALDQSNSIVNLE